MKTDAPKFLLELCYMVGGTSNRPPNDIGNSLLPWPTETYALFAASAEAGGLDQPLPMCSNIKPDRLSVWVSVV